MLSLESACAIFTDCHILIMLIIIMFKTLLHFALFRLLSSILRLFYIQSLAVQNRLGESLSPQLDSTCMYFMRRFIEGYLIPNEENYSEVTIIEMHRSSQTLICLGLIGHVNNIPTMQFFIGISRNTQSKSYMLSLMTECVWEFRNIALWDTH